MQNVLESIEPEARTKRTSLGRLFAIAVLLFVALAFGASAVRPWVSHVFTQAQTMLMLQEQQHRIERSVFANKAITQVITRAIASMPSATRLRVALIHPSAANVPMRFDVTHMVVNPGNPPGELYTNVPLSQWNAYIEPFLRGQCATLVSRDPTLSIEARTRLAVLQTAGLVGCPLRSRGGDLLGALFFTWDDAAKVPADLAPATTLLRGAAAEVAKQVPNL